MSATRLAVGLFAFQLPVVLVAALGVILGGYRDFVVYLVLPASVALLLGSLVTWGLEALRPLPPDRRARRLLRYQLPVLVLAHLPIGFYAFLGGALFRGSFSWTSALEVYGILAGGYAVCVAAPLVALASWGAVTPPPRP